MCTYYDIYIQRAVSVYIYRPQFLLYIIRDSTTERAVNKVRDYPIIFIRNRNQSPKKRKRVVGKLVVGKWVVAKVRMYLLSILGESPHVEQLTAKVSRDIPYVYPCSGIPYKYIPYIHLRCAGVEEFKANVLRASAAAIPGYPDTELRRSPRYAVYLRAAGFRIAAAGPARRRLFPICRRRFGRRIRCCPSRTAISCPGICVVAIGHGSNP
jgi:hypothetical protein